ncbi:MAG: division/cell wall cluster transcriptional repressor MraZ [Clostridia bacterium]|nr:division/cell wall cluster transcriptional repressor MraZ [Clostridia bacterium]
MTFDGQGRVQLPIWARTEAHITKDVVTLGVGNFLELWDQATYENKVAEMSVGKINSLIYKKKNNDADTRNDK